MASESVTMRPRASNARWLSAQRVAVLVLLVLVVVLQAPFLSWTVRHALRMDSGKAMTQTSWNAAMVLLDVAAITLWAALPTRCRRWLWALPPMLLLGSALALPLGQLLRPLLHMIGAH